MSKESKPRFHQPCRVQIPGGKKIPGIGGGTKEFGNGMFDPASMVAEVEFTKGKLTYVSVHVGMITVDRDKPEAE